MKGLREKFRKNEGFTLVEMLIVVAIIAILVAVSIPLVNTSLQKAKEATDAANLRAAKAEAMIMYMNDQMGITTNSIAGNYWYDIESGKFYAPASTDPAKPTAGNGYNQSKIGSIEPKSGYITVTAFVVGGEEPIKVGWTAIS